MANSSSTVNALADEVADLLRHDNLDTRILVWISSAFNDIIRSTPSLMFLNIVTVQITAGNNSIDLLVDDDEPKFIEPYCGVFMDASKNVYAPRYKTLIDFSKFAKTSDGQNVTAAIPEIWTVAPSTTEPGKSTLHIYPKASDTITATIFYTGTMLTTPAGGGDMLDFPYHFENALIWGAAAFGARVLRPQLFPIFEEEYRSHVQDMNTILAYKPDLTPVLRSVVGPYARTSRLAPPQFPNQIPSS